LQKLTKKGKRREKEKRKKKGEKSIDPIVN